MKWQCLSTKEDNTEPQKTNLSSRLDVPQCYRAAAMSNDAWCHLHACSWLTHLWRRLHATAEYAVASTQISASESAAVQDVREQAPAHWLCNDEWCPRRSQSLRSCPPTPENHINCMRWQLLKHFHTTAI